jgi:hypothetical protein
VETNTPVNYILENVYATGGSSPLVTEPNPKVNIIFYLFLGNIDETHNENSEGINSSHIRTFKVYGDFHRWINKKICMSCQNT